FQGRFHGLKIRLFALFSTDYFPTLGCGQPRENPDFGLWETKPPSGNVGAPGSRNTRPQATKKSFFRYHITGLLPELFHLYALDHHHQLRPADRRGACAACRRDEGAPFEPLVIHHEASVLPVEQLEQVPVPVEENIHLPGGRVLSHRVPYQPAQTVETLAHIHRLLIKIIAVGGAKAEHQ